MKFKIEIDCDNAAFGDYPRDEIARILRETAELLEDDRYMKRVVSDINGNSVGTISAEFDE